MELKQLIKYLILTKEAMESVILGTEDYAKKEEIKLSYEKKVKELVNKDLFYMLPSFRSIVIETAFEKGVDVADQLIQIQNQTGIWSKDLNFIFTS